MDWRFIALFAACCLAPLAPVRADALPTTPETACSHGKVGARCRPVQGILETGSCQPSRCTKLDYSRWDRDASTAPPSVEYDCLRCVLDQAGDAGSPAGDDSGVQTTADSGLPAGSDSGVDASSNGGVDAGSAGGVTVSNDASAHTSGDAASHVADAGETVQSSASEADDAAAKDADGCVVAPARLGSHAAALALAGVLGWFIGRLRRRGP